jgi:hypothetical protein
MGKRHTRISRAWQRPGCRGGRDRTGRTLLVGNAPVMRACSMVRADFFPWWYTVFGIFPAFPEVCGGPYSTQSGHAG